MQPNPSQVEFWNERYEAPAFAYGKEPNAFLATALVNIPPGRMLFMGAGEGRNAVFAASLGWAVTAVDFSSAGREKALALAQANRVSLHYEVADVLSFSPDSLFDAIGMVFLHLPATARQQLYARVQQWLEPGGHLLLQGYTEDQLEAGVGGPKTPDLCFSLDELQQAFTGWQVHTLEQRHEPVNEGLYHQGDAHTVVAHLQKPG